MKEAKRPVALVTGGNRGLGRETARQLAEKGLHVVLTARRAEEAEEAARAIGGATAYTLDVTDEGSVAALADRVGDEVGPIEALVNNAGIALDGFNADVVRQTMAVNVGGVIRVTEAFLPLLAPGARVVNVSSGMGELTSLGTQLRRRFADPGLGVQEMTALLERFRSEVADGDHRDSGWPSSAYSVSKVAVNAYTRMLAARLGEAARVNAVCPGWVRTDMGGQRAPRSVEEGAQGIVWAALLPPDGPTGGFFRDAHPIPW